MGYFPDISVWQQPCSRAAMYSGDWGKALFASRCSYAGSYTKNCLLIISVQTHALKFANLVWLSLIISDVKSNFPQSPLYIAALEHGCCQTEISGKYPHAQDLVVPSRSYTARVIAYWSAMHYSQSRVAELPTTKSNSIRVNPTAVTSSIIIASEEGKQYPRERGVTVTHTQIMLKLAFWCIVASSKHKQSLVYYSSHLIMLCSLRMIKCISAMACVSRNRLAPIPRGPAHGDIFRIFPSGSSHVRGQQCTVAIGENCFSHRW